MWEMHKYPIAELKKAVEQEFELNIAQLMFN
jgi:hypothetical protein